MTEEEAKRAAATFEFPPFRAKALEVIEHTMTPHGDSLRHTGNWWLAVYDESGEYRLFDSPQMWLDFWNNPNGWIDGKRGVTPLTSLAL